MQRDGPGPEDRRIVWPDFREPVEGYTPVELIVHYDRETGVRVRGWWSGRPGDQFLPEDFETDPGWHDRIVKNMWKKLGLPDMSTYYSTWIPTPK